MSKSRRHKQKRRAQTFRKPKLYTQLPSTLVENVLSNEVNENLALLRYEQWKQADKEQSKAKFEALPPDTFRIRSNHVTRSPPSFFRGFSLQTIGLAERFFPFEILYKGSNPEETYFIRIDFSRELTETEELSLESVANPGDATGVWEVRSLDPTTFFQEEQEPLQEEDIITFFIRPHAYKQPLRYIKALPHFQEAMTAFGKAKYTAAPKLTSLRLKGFEEMMKKFEGSTGQQFPRNAQNLIEEHLLGRPHLQTYLRERDNLAKINTTLFED